MPKKTILSNFEEDLEELEKLVENLEKGELSLEESLACFERGIALTRNCQKALSEAEQKVNILLTDRETQKLQNFSTEEDDAT